MNLSALRETRTLLYLFIGFRLMLMLVYQPYLINNVERGLTTFGDFQHYFNLAKLSSDGKLPYRDYWYEFPPVFPILSLSVYALSSARGAPDFTAYATLLGLLMTIFDVGNLLLVIRIGNRLYAGSSDHNPGGALGWIYALLAAPLIFSWWSFEPIVAFCFLLAIASLIERHDTRSAVVTAVGALTKLFPLITIAVAVRFRDVRGVLRYAAVALIITAIGLAALLAVGGRFGVPSLVAQFNKASYESVWALIDHNYKTGNFGPISDHFDPARAYDLQGNPAVLPAWLRAIVFGAIGVFVFIRTRRFDGRGILAFAAITVTIFFLWAQGWSPQWQVTLLPLILLSFPTPSGVLICLMLELISFAEYPTLFARTGDTGGVISAAQLPIYTLLILARTGILIGFAVALYRQLRLSRAAETL